MRIGRHLRREDSVPRFLYLHYSIEDRFPSCQESKALYRRVTKDFDRDEAMKPVQIWTMRCAILLIAEVVTVPRSYESSLLARRYLSGALAVASAPTKTKDPGKRKIFEPSASFFPFIQHRI